MIIATQRKLIGEKFTKSWGVPGGGTVILVFSDLCLPVLIVSAEIELSCFGFPASAYEYHEQRTPTCGVDKQSMAEHYYNGQTRRFGEHFCSCRMPLKRRKVHFNK